MPDTNNKIYLENINIFSARQEQIRKSLSLISSMRLLLFLVFAWFLYTSFSSRFSGYDILYAVLTIPGFLLLVLFAGRKKTEYKFLQQLIFINRNEIDISEGRPSFLGNGGQQTPVNAFATDLGLFGKDSLFHLINRTGSDTGREQLAVRISKPFIQASDIINYQQAGIELSGKISFRQRLLAQALLLEEEEALPQLKEGFSIARFANFEAAFWRIMASAWPLAGIVLFIYSVWVDNYRFLLLFGLTGLILLGPVFKKINLLYNHISKRGYLYSQYARCFELIGKEEFTNPYLLAKQEEIKQAANAFRKLSKITGLFDLRMSLFSFVLNGLFILDVRCARAYLRWTRQYQHMIGAWLNTLGEIELLNSLGSFQFNHPSFIFPEPITGTLSVNATGMGHPLMNEKVAVLNDISIGDPSKLHIITGSNMAGKSTFLRTVGLNMVLAQIGAPVFAKTFHFRPVQFLTSFHHIDSLSESTSYFYAELRALQTIIKTLDEPVPALVLLDEVMRGTNSKDKHDGTALLIKKILGYNCLTLIATHDTELGVLADAYPGKIENFSFESELSEDGLRFDFIKRTGVARSTNATYLMQKLGII